MMRMTCPLFPPLFGGASHEWTGDSIDVIRFKTDLACNQLRAFLSHGVVGLVDFV